MAFIGLRVPAETSAQFSSIIVPGTKEPVDKLHVTMIYLGQGAPILDIFRAMVICFEMAQRFAPIDMTAPIVTCFPPDSDGKTPVVARLVNPGLHTFRQELAQKLDEAGIAYSKKFPEYKPHVTLAYADAAQQAELIDPIRWKANRMTIWGGDKEDELINTEIELRGGTT